MNGGWWTLDGILYKSTGHKLVTILLRNGLGTVTITGENWKIYCKVWLVSVFISFLGHFFLICRILQFLKELDLSICIIINKRIQRISLKFFLWWRKLSTALEFPPNAPIIKVLILIIKLHQNFHKMFK